MDFLMETLQDKGKLIKLLLKTIEESNKYRDGMSEFSESLVRDNPNRTIENISKCLATTMKVVAIQSTTIQNLAIIALVTCQSSSFDSDIAQMLNKLGRGQEALQQMFKNKMAGK